MAEQVLDCLGEACPIPLVKAQKVLKEMPVGDVLIVNVDHSCAIKNIPDWTKEVGYDCRVDELSDSEWNIVITKTK